MYTIGELAQLVGVSTHTLRYYEKENIILPRMDAEADPSH
ncbi:DNA-binding transcriptional MerR regulator [Neobacillus drentensis]|nr:DNA-binding transcriptional MerR regulator [Neobacillus drentensis]